MLTLVRQILVKLNRRRCRYREGDREGQGVSVGTGGCLIVSSFWYEEVQV